MLFVDSEAGFFGCFEALFWVSSGVYMETGSGFGNGGLKQRGGQAVTGAFGRTRGRR